ncbi:hypothetical protein BGZ96_002844, partial [Linnemannia gamsii]
SRHIKDLLRKFLTRISRPAAKDHPVSCTRHTLYPQTNETPLIRPLKMRYFPATLLAVLLGIAASASAYVQHRYCSTAGGTSYPCNQGDYDCTLDVCGRAGGVMYIKVCTITSEATMTEWHNWINRLGFPRTSCSAQLGNESS